MLHVQLLGEVTAVRDGEPVALSRPHRRLLAYLALHPGPHERDALAARFWPDLPTARANLRTAVWTLRRSLGADAVQATRDVGRARPGRATDESTRRSGDAEPCPELDDDWAGAARVEPTSAAACDSTRGRRGR